jgi:hypothetical protein
MADVAAMPQFTLHAEFGAQKRRRKLGDKFLGGGSFWLSFRSRREPELHEPVDPDPSRCGHDEPSRTLPRPS